MSSQPSDHASWRLPDANNSQNLNVTAYHQSLNHNPNGNANPNPNAANANPSTNANTTTNANTNANPNPGSSSMLPRLSNAASSSAHPPAQASRKRQFRFSVRADIELLRLVVRLNPYGAAHGGRLHKWQAIADTLRDSGIDIDFRRARDRTGLLLDQWREKDLPLLRRSGSGNHEDQAQKEELLQQISDIEQAARPRDNDWRSREQTRLRNPQAGGAGPVNVSHPENQSGPRSTLSVMAGGGDHRASQRNNFSTEPPAPTQLPPIVQKQDHHPVPPGRSEPDTQTVHYGSHHGPPEKQFKNSQGQATISPRFSQPLFGNPSSPSKTIPLHSQNVDRRSPPRGDLSPFPNHHLPLLRQPGQAVARQGHAHILSSTSLDISPMHPVTNSPRVGEVHNPQLDPANCGITRLDVLENENANLRHRVARLERRLDELSAQSAKRLEFEERRLQWEQESEAKRIQLEQERMAKEFECRRTEQEERRRKENEDKEERKHLFGLVMRSQQHSSSEGDNEEQ